MRENIRTAKFWWGLGSAIEDALKAKGAGEKVNIAYLGCGPFATLAIPAAAVYGDKVAFHCVDIHQQSVRYAQELIEALGISSSFETWLSKDALDVKFGEDFPVPEAALMEMTERGLTSEPQAHVTQELASQFGENTVLIPEKVSVNVAFRPDGSLILANSVPIVELTKAGIEAFGAMNDDTLEVIRDIPIESPVGRDCSAWLVTYLQIYKKICLGPNADDGITKVVGLGRVDADPGECVRVHLPLCGREEDLRMENPPLET